jgi:hypothetical protein
MARDPIRRLRDLGQRLQPHVRALGAALPDALRLFRRDRETLQTWARHLRAVETTLGAKEAEAYTATLLAALGQDPITARALAHALPDHLAQVQPADRGRLINLVQAVIADSPGAAPLVAQSLPRLIGVMDDQSLSDFVAQGVALHGRSPREAESFLSLESQRARTAATTLQRGTGLLEVHRVLAHYARAHCGVAVRVRPGSGRTFSDGKHIYLPERIEVFDDERDAQIYRVRTAWSAGFIEFGSLHADLSAMDGPWPEPRPDESELDRFFRSFPNTALAKDLYLMLEGARVEARVRAEYPGVDRQMDALGQAWRPALPESAGGSPAAQAVGFVAATLVDRSPQPPASAPAMAAAQAVLAVLERLPLQTAGLADTLAAVQEAFPHLYDLLEQAAPGGLPEAQDTAEYRPSPAAAGGLDLDISLDDPTRAASFLESLLQRPELDEATADGSTYAEMAAFLERLEPPEGPLREEDPSRVTAGRPPGESRLAGDGITRVGAIRYPEWDHRIGDHRPGWVQLIEYQLAPGSADFVDAIRETYGPLVSRLRRSFEALRPASPERQRGLTDGDELDIDRVVAAMVSRRTTGEMSDRLYQRRLPNRRDVAVAFLVDLSSSTNEVANVEGKRIIDVEREALVLAAEAVDAIGDDCAIYGYSGYGRDEVAFYIAKDFTDPWDDTVRRRVGRMSWKMENRDGAAIRHATAKLSRWPAKVKLLILLSDGKPLDCGCDTYSDTYAQEDTRVALQEARQSGVHPFCITVDPHGRDYLSRMYGEHGYTIIDRVELLPERLPALYRRLTR